MGNICHRIYFTRDTSVLQGSYFGPRCVAGDTYRFATNSTKFNVTDFHCNIIVEIIIVYFITIKLCFVTKNIHKTFPNILSDIFVLAVFQE